jgi:hypothetical protein
VLKYKENILCDFRSISIRLTPHDKKVHELITFGNIPFSNLMEGGENATLGGGIEVVRLRLWFVPLTSSLRVIYYTNLSIKKE